jgi:type III pantothenate kinase
MLLAIDIGNTNIVLGLFKDKELLAHWRMTTHLHKTVDEYSMFILDLFRSRETVTQEIDAIICSNVVPPLTSIFMEMGKKYFGITPLFVGHQMETGLKIRYDNPQEIGADRIVNAAAGFEIYGGPLIIVDFGTATTFCAISAQGEYLGGVISPGVLIATEALFNRTAKLPKVELITPNDVIGKSTISSIQSGILIGFACLVDGMVARMKNEMKSDPFVVATGGLASLIASESKLIQEVRPNLTLEGLYILYEKNRSTKFS